jgi:hypothetical protein
MPSQGRLGSIQGTLVCFFFLIRTVTLFLSPLPLSFLTRTLSFSARCPCVLCVRGGWVVWFCVCVCVCVCVCCVVHSPHAGGEDGTCGTESVCGTFASTLYYADELGFRALHGFAQHQRQDLLGGRYGLLAVPHDSEFLADGYVSPSVRRSLHDTSLLNAQAEGGFWGRSLWQRASAVRGE